MKSSNSNFYCYCFLQGKPVYNPDGTPKMLADGSGPEYVFWYLSDLDLVRAMFTDFVKVQVRAICVIMLWPWPHGSATS